MSRARATGYTDPGSVQTTELGIGWLESELALLPVPRFQNRTELEPVAETADFS